MRDWKPVSEVWLNPQNGEANRQRLVTRLHEKMTTVLTTTAHELRR